MCIYLGTIYCGGDIVKKIKEDKRLTLESSLKLSTGVKTASYSPEYVLNSAGSRGLLYIVSVCKLKPCFLLAVFVLTLLHSGSTEGNTGTKSWQESRSSREHVKHAAENLTIQMQLSVPQQGQFFLFFFHFI